MLNIKCRIVSSDTSLLDEIVLKAHGAREQLDIFIKSFKYQATSLALHTHTQKKNENNSVLSLTTVDLI